MSMLRSSAHIHSGHIHFFSALRLVVFVSIYYAE
jgi:hypothetical protein